jgi:hypothetical protein
MLPALRGSYFLGPQYPPIRVVKHTLYGLPPPIREVKPTCYVPEYPICVAFPIFSRPYHSNMAQEASQTAIRIQHIWNTVIATCQEQSYEISTLSGPECSIRVICPILLRPYNLNMAKEAPQIATTWSLYRPTQPIDPQSESPSLHLTVHDCSPPTPQAPKLPKPVSDASGLHLPLLFLSTGPPNPSGKTHTL